MKSHNLKGQNGHPGLLLNSPRQYDLLAWVFALGRPRAFRSRMLEPAKLRPRETVLDVGCGTGSLALLAKESVGPDGRVVGVDASPAMIEHAQRKAAKACSDVAFQVAPAQALPFEDACFDVVLSTLMFHHLPRTSREQLGREIARVLRPDGRVLVVDFAKSTKGSPGLLHRGHGATTLADMIKPLTSAGLHVASTGQIESNNLQFVVARPGDEPAQGSIDSAPSEESSTRQGRVGIGAGLLLAVGLIGVIVLHLVGGIAARDAFVHPWSLAAFLAVGVTIVIAKLTLVSFVRRRRARMHRHNADC